MSPSDSGRPAPRPGDGAPGSTAPTHGPGPTRGSAARLGLALGPLLLSAVLLTPPPAGMTPDAWRAAGVGLLMASWWVTEAIPIPTTALVPLVLFPLLGVVGIDEAAGPYAHPVIFLFLGGFLIAAALQRCGLHRRMALTILRFGGTSPRGIVAGVMGATAFLSMWVSNTATVAMMLPLVLSLLTLAGEGRSPGPAGEGESPGRVASPSGVGGAGPGAAALAPALLLGTAYAANVGGLGTLIGTPPNALLAGFLSEAYGVEIGFVRWMLFGLPLVLVALPLVWLLLVRVLHPLGSEPLAGSADAVRRAVSALGPVRPAERWVGGITALTAGAWIFRPLLERWVPGLSDAGIAVAGALLLFLLPLRSGDRPLALDWETAEALPWGVLVLFGGGLSLAGAVSATGLDAWLGGALSAVGGWPLWAVVAVVTTTVILLTELTSNTATAAAFLPVMGALAVAVGTSPLLLTVPTAVAASCAFMLPVATPPNAIVFGSGRLELREMMRAGVWLNLLMAVLATVATLLLAPVVFPGR